MPINTSENRVEVFAEETKTFDKWWVSKLRVTTDEQTGKVSAYLLLKKFCYREDGSPEFLAGSDIHYIIDDVYAEAAQDQDVAALIGSIISGVSTLGAKKNLL